MKAKCSTANKKDTTKKRLGVLIFLKKTLTLVSRIVKALYAPFTKCKYSLVIAMACIYLKLG